jgi:hypothetical protein
VKIYVSLTPEEAEMLRRQAQEQRRPPRDHAAYLIAKGLHAGYGLNPEVDKLEPAHVRADR